MSALRRTFPGDLHCTGGITGYPLDRLYEEVAFISYYLHWPHDQLMQLPHGERKRWCDEVSKINRNLSDNKGK